MHILHHEVLCNFYCFVHEFVFEVDDDNARAVVSLIVRAVALLEESFLSLHATQLAQFFFVQDGREHEGNDLGLPVSPIGLSEND